MPFLPIRMSVNPSLSPSVSVTGRFPDRWSMSRSQWALWNARFRNPRILENVDFSSLEHRILDSLGEFVSEPRIPWATAKRNRLHSSLIARVIGPYEKKSLDEVAKDVLGFRKGPKILEIRELEPRSWLEIVASDDDDYYPFVVRLAEKSKILTIDSVCSNQQERHKKTWSKQK